MFSSKQTEWGTPFDFYHDLDREFHFTLDACTSKNNPLGTPRFFTKEDDGLTKDFFWSCIYKSSIWS